MAGWGIRDLKRRCQERRELLAQYPHLATPQELEDYWPGGKENRAKGIGAWIYCYAQYSSFWRRLERLGDPADPSQQLAADREAAHQAALDAFRDRAIPVDLVDGSVVTVYPKSFDVLTYIDTLNDDLLWLTERIQALAKEWGAEAVLQMGAYKQGFARTQLLICWILTTPGCDAPFDLAQPEPDPPDTIRTLREVDVLAILRAHLTLHRKRPDLICLWMRQSGETEPKASWTTIAAAAARDQGVSVEQMLRRRSFTAWLSQAMVTWKGEAEAAERAQQQATTARRGPMPQPVEML